MKKLMEGAKTYIKQNWLFLLIMLAGSLATCLLISQTVLYADDYSLGIYSADGLKGAIDYLTEHYFTWGGGYTSSIVIILIAMGPFFWRAALAVTLILFVGLSVKLLCKNHPKQKWFVTLILWALVFLVSVQVSREAIYWLDGGIAYLFSMFQAFLVLYFFHTRLVQKVSHKYDIVVFPIIAFFGGWSSAQSGGMAILISFGIILWQRFLKKEKVKPLYWISATLTIIGFGVYYFAPGNYARLEWFHDFTELGFFDRLRYRASNVFRLTTGNSEIEFTGTPFYIYLTTMLLAIVDLSSIKQEKNRKVKILRLCCSAYLLLYAFAFFIGTLGIPKISSVASYLFKYIDLLHFSEYGALHKLGIISYLASILTVVTSSINAFFLGKRQNSNPFLFIVMLTGFLANFAMLMAPHMPYRTTFYTIAFMMMAIAYLLIYAKENNLRILPITFVIFSIMNWQLFILLTIVYVFIAIFTPNKKTQANIDLAVFTCTLLIFAGINYGQMLINYHRNKTIYNKNMSALQEAAATYAETGDAPTIIYLKRPYNRFYGFDNFADYDWIEKDLKTYLGLPQELDLQYEGEQK